VVTAWLRAAERSSIEAARDQVASRQPFAEKPPTFPLCDGMAAEISAPSADRWMPKYPLPQRDPSEISRSTLFLKFTSFNVLAHRICPTNHTRAGQTFNCARISDA
jgi:hypothetical protein